MNDVIINLIPPFIALLGLEMCETKKGTYEEFADKSGVCPWCTNPIVQLIYGASQIIGVIFVFGLVAYYSVALHWWYFLLYFGVYALAKLLSVIVLLLLSPITNFFENNSNFGSLRFRRFLGTLLIYSGIFLFIYLTRLI